ncbi:MAG: hypothetical protein GF364_12100 [Candidatus Lokiarchaeota archaeon]|nr:hypothetical protein [Candidatus Lokiarchaeota archaeon]
MRLPEENHKNEQYFFTKATQDNIIEICSNLRNIAFLCCPSLSLRHELSSREDIKFFDIDARFNSIEYFDISNPKYVGEFDLVVIDPPFFNLSLKKMRKAILSLLNYNFQKKLLITYLIRREKVLLRVFTGFDLKLTGYAEYNNVDRSVRNKIGIYRNF